MQLGVYHFDHSKLAHRSNRERIVVIIIKKIIRISKNLLNRLILEQRWISRRNARGRDIKELKAESRKRG